MTTQTMVALKLEDIDMMDFNTLQRLAWDARKYGIDASELSKRANDRDAKAVKAIRDAVKAAKSPQTAETAPKAKTTKKKAVKAD